MIGRDVDYSLLLTVAERDEETLKRHLSQLVASELLYPRGTPPRAHYLFKHVLIQDVAYESLLRKRRQILHPYSGETVERLEAGRIQHAALLAYHFARSENDVAAVSNS